MEENKKRKMAFYEIESGRMATQMQQVFEDAQVATHDHGLASEVNLKIKIFPSTDGRFGQIQYSISKKLPTQQSIKLTTELTAGGLVISDGKSAIDILQEELEFPQEPKILTINGGK